ncbi:MAG: hypothetical protein ACNA70_06735 [Brevefilum sp.]
MTINRMAQNIEIKFWNAIIPVMTDEGILMKTFRVTKKAVQEKVFNILMLILLWAAIGFVSGVLIGRILWIVQGL